jgi:MSHA pilin protein MshC
MRPALAFDARMRGFTLVELLVVIVLVGILSTIAVGRFAGPSAFDELGYAQELASAARYAQKLALSTRCQVRFQVTADGGYRLTRPDSFAAGNCAANFNAQVVSPVTGQAPYSGTAPSGIAVAAVDGLPALRDFDSEGKISPASDLTVNVGSRTVVLRAGGGQILVCPPTPSTC